MENPDAGSPRRLLCPRGDRGGEDTKRQRNDEGQRAARLHVGQTSARQDPRINIGPFSQVAERWRPAASRPTRVCLDAMIVRYGCATDHVNATAW